MAFDEWYEVVENLFLENGCNILEFDCSWIRVAYDKQLTPAQAFNKWNTGGFDAAI